MCAVCAHILNKGRRPVSAHIRRREERSVSAQISSTGVCSVCVHTQKTTVIQRRAFENTWR